MLLLQGVSGAEETEAGDEDDEAGDDGDGVDGGDY